MDIQLDDLWHTVQNEDIFQKLKTSESGLTEKEARHRIKIYKPNVLEIKTVETPLRIFFRQLHNPLIYVLTGSTLLALFLGKVADGIVILSVVILNTIIGFIQEYKAHKTIKTLTSMVPQKATVQREGNVYEMDSSEVVPGDIIVLQPGDKVPADLRIFSIKNLQCDEAALTGESLPVNKIVEPVSEDASLGDRTCMAFSGTYVTSGTGLGVVVSTGMKTELGKISALTGSVQTLETPLFLSLKKISFWITWGVLLVSIGLFIIGYIRGSVLLDASLAAITLAVAAIPEGLPAIVTIATSISVRRMAKRNAIVRELPAAESLGSATIICTDKTGTLTYNEMTVQKIFTLSGFSFVSGIGYFLNGEIFIEHPNQEEVEELLRAIILCNDASLNEKENQLDPIGDPTEIALLVAARKIGLLENQLREEFTRLDVVPFDPAIKMMATLHSNPETEKCSLYIKGAPEEIIDSCIGLVNPDDIYHQVRNMAKEGMRVLAVAKKEVLKDVEKIDENMLRDGYTFLGLVGMIDPPRKEVYAAIQACYEAGITVKMVTGDHPLTAESIGRELRITGDGKVLTGKEVNKFSSKEWIKASQECHVFARVSPEHKLKLVRALQETHQVVAMTGDGVNDAAALKQADIGISMGVKGTAVAREASDIILADDNFASIEAAVEEGRRVYDNLIKSLAFVLPTSLAQALVIFFAVLFFPIKGGALLHPMSPVQILWVNLVVAIALSLPLAFEPAEYDIMKRPPRKKNTPLLDKYLIFKTFIVSLIMAICTIGLFIWKYNTQLESGRSEITALYEAQTMAVTAIMLFQIFYLFNCKTLRESLNKTHFFSNQYIFIGIGVVLLAQIGFIYFPFMNKLFKTVGINLEDWLICILIAFIIVPLIALEKFVRKKIERKNTNL